MKLISLLLISSLTFAMGSKTSWYDGPSERKSEVNGWMNFAKECMQAPGFNTKNIKLKYEPVKGEKRYPSGWAYKNKQGRWVHGETYFNSKTNFRVLVATDPSGRWDEDAHQTEGHEVGHVVAYNQFNISGHDRRFAKCFAGWEDKLTDDMYETIYGENGEIVHDSSYDEDNDPPPPPQETGCPANGSKSNLIKPVAENGGKLVLVLSCEYLKNTESCHVGSEKGRDSTNYTELHNGARVHFRFSKPGSQYGTQTIKLKLKDGTELCYSANMGTRKEGWKFSKCGSTNPNPPPPPTGSMTIEVKSDGSLVVSPELASAFYRAPKFFYSDGPNEGDKVQNNAIPNESYVGSGSNWQLRSGTSIFSGRHGVLINTKAGTIDPSKVKWIGNFERVSTKSERDPSGLWDSWGAHIKYTTR